MQLSETHGPARVNRQRCHTLSFKLFHLSLEEICRDNSRCLFLVFSTCQIVGSGVLVLEVLRGDDFEKLGYFRRSCFDWIVWRIIETHTHLYLLFDACLEAAVD